MGCPLFLYPAQLKSYSLSILFKFIYNIDFFTYIVCGVSFSYSSVANLHLFEHYLFKNIYKSDS